MSRQQALIFLLVKFPFQFFAVRRHILGQYDNTATCTKQTRGRLVEVFPAAVMTDTPSSHFPLPPSLPCVTAFN